jgi:redox-sensitive bicupin YhaK (pirin superfamily)
MRKVRRAEERGHARHGWLDSHHTFSFADYHDPAHMGFRSLRVINDDRVEAGAGFGTHGHRDMEIVSYVLEGALAHRDSMGNSGVIRPGEVQRMSAGTGVMHSEMNGSKTEGVHFLQIWILPDRAGHAPGYEQKHYPNEEKRGRLRLVASSDGAEGSVRLHQDVRLYAGLFDRGESARLPIAEGRYVYLHVARGSLSLDGETLEAGDGVQISGERALSIEGRDDAEVLVFDLA